MNQESESMIPRDFDFPAGRERQRQRHLIAVISGEGSARSRRVAGRFGMRRMTRPALAAAAGAVVCLALVPIGQASLAGRAIASINDLLGRAEAARDALPDIQVLAVFEHPRTGADALPPAAQDVVRQLDDAPVAAAIKPGQGEVSQARLALANVGPANASLYLVPTDKGTVCMIWSPETYGGGCTQGFEPGTDVIFVRGTTDGVPHVWGIFRDDVSKVTALVNGNSEPVSVGQSAFFFAGPTLPDHLVLTLNDGTTKTVPVDGLATLH